MQVLPIRLGPLQDLKKSLQDVAQQENIQAGCILSVVGSLQQACLRFADQSIATTLTGRFEILALGGTLSVHGLHLHLTIADGQGQTIGGHLVQGCLIYTTAEIVMGILPGLEFRRTFDPHTGFRELEIRSHLDRQA